MYIQNNFIISEHLHATEMIGYMDAVVDEINDRLQTSFPVFSEWADFVDAYNTAHQSDPGFVALDATIYTAIPAQYLRKVVAPGTAVNFFTNDEEGEQVASKFYIQYERNLSTMVRDYINLVPEMYQVTNTGFITTTYNETEDDEASNEGIVISNANNSL